MIFKGKRLTGFGRSYRAHRMKRIILMVCACALVSGAAAMAQEGPFGPTALDSLASSKVGGFPTKWRTWPLQRDKAGEVYSVGEEGGKRFIKAYDDKDLSTQIFLNFDWPLDERPMLSWKWRATELPPGAAENNDATNDSACGVYVIFGKYDGHAIKYVWSSSLAPGTVVTRREGKLKIKVLDSGAAKKGSWVQRTVDVASDYEALFGRKPDKKPSGIGLLTDGNAVHKPAGCDYSDFSIARK